MPKLVDASGQEIFKDVVLWTGKAFADTGLVNVNYNPFNFKELIIELEYNTFAIIPVIESRNNYKVPYAFNSGYIRTGFVEVDITTATIKVVNHYIAHQFNASHPDDSAMNIMRIIGRY